MEPVAVTEKPHCVLSRNPAVQWGSARPGLFVRYPSRWLDARSFRLITANQNQRMKLAPAYHALWLAAEKPGRLETLIRRVQSLSDDHAGIPCDALARSAHAMVAAKVLVSRPAMGPFIATAPHEAHVYGFGAKTLAIDPATCSLWELTSDAAECLCELASADTPSGQGTAQPELSPAAIELGACCAAGFFQPRPETAAPPPMRKNDGRWKAVSLTLDLSDSCNFACRYCYVDRKAQPAIMSESTMRCAFR